MLKRKNGIENDESKAWSLSYFFDWELERKHRTHAWVWLVLLYLVGIALWGSLFNWRRSPLNYHDWEGINLPRFDAVRDAIHYRMLPLHVNCKECLHYITDRFLVLPDVITTPQMLLMTIMDVDTFAMVDIFFNYTIATLGLIYLRQKFKISLISYSYLFFLFNFNGYIQAHYAVGHATWGGYFLFPWYFLLVFHLFDQGPSWQWVSSIALLSFYTILAGSQHHFTWMMLFLATLAVVYRQGTKWIMAAVIFSGFLSAIRLLPPLIALNSFTSGDFIFLSGYPTLYDFFAALVTMHPVNYVVDYISIKVDYWEYDYFVGIIGVVFIGYFGLLNLLRDQKMSRSFYYLLLPAMVVFLLSQGHIYEYTLYRLPLFSSERVTSRMVSIPVTFFIITGAVYFQKFLDANPTSVVRWLAGGGLIVLISEISMHILTWRIDRIAPFLEPKKMQFPGNSIVNHPDPQYIFVLYVGFTLTLISALILVTLTLREKRRNQTLT